MGSADALLFLFSLGQHSALNVVTSRSQEVERIFAQLDDFQFTCYVACALLKCAPLLRENCQDARDMNS